jgi:hypothetical protein
MEREGGRMLRRFLESTIAVCLALLLAVDAVGQDALPQSVGPASAPSNTAGSDSMPAARTIAAGTEINVMALEAVSSASAKVGEQVYFVVADPVVTYGFVLVRAGTPLLGTITRVTRAKLHHRDGRLDIRIDDLRIGNSIRLKFTDHEPVVRLPTEQTAASRKAKAHAILRAVLLAPVVATYLPIAIPQMVGFAIGMWNEGGQPTGQDASLPACAEKAIYVRAPVRIEMSSLMGAEHGAALPTQSQCALRAGPQELARIGDGFPGVSIR